MTCLPVDHEADIEMEAREVHEIGWYERFEFLGKDRRVLHADLEGNDRSDVSEHAVAHGFRKLAQVLVCDVHAEPVLAGFTQETHERIGRKVLELVDVKIERIALARARVRALQDRCLELRNQY